MLSPAFGPVLPTAHSVLRQFMQLMIRSDRKHFVGHHSKTNP